MAESGHPVPAEQVPIPAALAARPWDARRDVPIPVMNMHIDDRGTPFVDFLGVDPKMAEQLGAHRLCGGCGKPLDPEEIVFLGTPDGLFDFNVVSDPPMHTDCARAAALRLCPYLHLQRYKRAPVHRLHPEVYIPEGGPPPKPAWWVFAVTRSYQMAVLPQGPFVFLVGPLLRWRPLTYTGPDNTLAEGPWQTTPPAQTKQPPTG